jgi:hypothetical protein
MMREQVFALLNQGGLHNIDLPRYCNLGLGHAFGIWHGVIGYDIENFNPHHVDITT